MGTAFIDFGTCIPAYKLCPPPLDPARHLTRDSLVKALLSQRQRHRLILLEAQAGQGKTILAAQFISRLKSPCGWYQIGPEDADPPRFLSTLLSCLMSAFTGFASPLLADMLRKGEINASEYPRYLEILCTDLAKGVTRDSWLVFDG